ncbi:MAG: Nif11-like leader peptide family natural product precursor [Desulfobaccales bacterium]
MKTGYGFIQRMQKDELFRRRVKGYPSGEERLAFLQREGYDFSPFIQIINNLSSGQWPTGGAGQAGGSATPVKSRSGFLGRISQIFRPSKSFHPER